MRATHPDAYTYRFTSSRCRRVCMLICICASMSVYNFINVRVYKIVWAHGRSAIRSAVFVACARSRASSLAVERRSMSSGPSLAAKTSSGSARDLRLRGQRRRKKRAALSAVGSVFPCRSALLCRLALALTPLCLNTGLFSAAAHRLAARALRLKPDSPRSAWPMGSASSAARVSIQADAHFRQLMRRNVNGCFVQHKPRPVGQVCMSCISRTRGKRSSRCGLASARSTFGAACGAARRLQRTQCARNVELGERPRPNANGPKSVLLGLC